MIWRNRNIEKRTEESLSKHKVSSPPPKKWVRLMFYIYPNCRMMKVAGRDLKPIFFLKNSSKAATQIQKFASSGRSNPHDAERRLDNHLEEMLGLKSQGSMTRSRYCCTLNCVPQKKFRQSPNSPLHPPISECDVEDIICGSNPLR
jgi:hypothetical protein